MNYSSEFVSLAGVICLMSAFFLVGCSSSDTGLPPHVEQARNLVVLDSLQQPISDLIIERMLVFDDSLHLDKINDVRVDTESRVYISGEGWQRRQVHIFDGNGAHIDSLGTFGREWGEFQQINHIYLHENDIYLFDGLLSRISVFDKNSFELKQLLSFEIDSLKFSDDVGNNLISKPVSMFSSSTFVIALHKDRNPAYEPVSDVTYFLADKNGEILNAEITVLPDLHFLVGDYAGRPAPFTLTLPEQPLVIMSDQGELYTANTQEFFIRVWNERGEEVRAFYVPYNRSTMDPAEVIHPRFSHNDQLLRVRESARYPETWPALYSMVVDDGDRIWVSTITDNRDELEWWVIDQENERLQARFTWPFDRKIKYVRDGEIYAVEENSQGFEYVVKYRVTIAE